MSHRSSDQSKKGHHGANNMPSFPDSRSQPSHPSLQDRSGRSVRAPGHRRHSTLYRQEDSHRSSHQQRPTEGDRQRYWDTILGSQPGFPDSARPQSSSSSSPENPLHGRNARDPNRRDNQHNTSRGGNSSSSHSRRRTNTAEEYNSSGTARSPPPKPFCCEHCPRRFERRGHLESHVNAVHHMQQPFHCRDCGKAFSHRSSLYRHVKGVHEKNQYQGNSSNNNNRQGPSGSGSSFGFGFMQ